MPKYNPMVLNKIIVKILNKYVIEFIYKKTHKDQNFAKKPDIFETCKMSI